MLLQKKALALSKGLFFGFNRLLWLDGEYWVLTQKQAYSMERHARPAFAQSKHFSRMPNPIKSIAAAVAMLW